MSSPNPTVKQDPANELLSRLRQQTRELFIHPSLAAEVEQRVMQKWLSGSLEGQSVDEFIAQNLPRAVEDCFFGLRTACVQYCRQILIRPDRADDLVQEALLRLIRSERPVQQLQPWLRKVIYHLVAEQYGQDKAQAEFLRRLERDHESLSRLVKLPQEESQSGEFGVLLPEMLKHPDFLAWQEMCRFPNLRAWAEANSLSYSQATQLSKQHRRNLKAACLRKLGWKTTTDILDYQDYKSLQRYVRKLVRSGLAAAAGESRKHRYPADLAEIFTGFIQLHEWQVTLLDGSRYRINIVGLDADQRPLIISATLGIKDNCRIRTESLKRLPPPRIAVLPPNFRLPVEKGLVLLTREQLEDLIRPQK